MAIMKCRECGGKVSSEAATCPHCGVNQPALQKQTTSIGAAKKKSSFWKIAGLVVLVLWIIGFVSQQSGTRSESKSTAATTSTPEPAAAAGSGPQCFNRGDAIATVYLANIKQAADVGMLASEMMDKGCQQAVGDQGAGCVMECKLGFKAKAKQWVKDGSLN